MKKILCSMILFCGVLAGVPAIAANNTFVCGDGYVLADRSKIDGITAKECVKLWCMDLETGVMMGNGNNAASGYRATNAPVEMRDNKNNSISCFGERKWCSGETVGEWNEEYGGYTRRGGDTATYKSYKKGGCFAWRLGKPDCEGGTTAILKNDEWVCVTETPASSGGGRSSGMRRTGVIRH